MNTLRFSDSVTAVANLATGTGVQEDFADCAWMGYCITFDLDAANGSNTWNQVTLKGPSPSGAGTVPLKGDIFDPTQAKTIRERLHDTLKVDTYEPRLGTNEMHFGTLCNTELGSGGYIDVRFTIDWLQARLVEADRDVLAAAAAAKRKISYLDNGVAVFDAVKRAVLQRAEVKGHIIFDGAPLDLNNPQSTGSNTPSVAEQNQADINTFLALRDEVQEKFRYAQPLRIGAGGGIGTPDAALAAFMLGAAYFVTGSVNQACVESGASEHTRKLLSELDMADVAMAPAGDMFEMGVKVQVLKRGTMFAMRAQKLYEFYSRYNAWEEIPQAERDKLEKTVFKRDFESIWNDTVKFFMERNPRQVGRGNANPKDKMALVFRWYLGP